MEFEADPETFLKKQDAHQEHNRDDNQKGCVGIDSEVQAGIIGQIQQTPTPSEGVTNSFTVNNIPDGNYTWYINCTDDSFNANRNSSEVRNLSVTRMIGLRVLVSTDKTTYEKGTLINESVCISSYVVDEYNNAKKCKRD
jgi:hypothetical protein